MNPQFKPLAVFLLLFSVPLVPSWSWAEGSLTLRVQTGQTRQKFILQEEGEVVTGYIREGLTVNTPLEGTFETNLITITVGEQDFPLERIDLGGFIAYGGVLWDNRGFSASAEKTDGRWVLNGFIENDMNRLIEFRGVADDAKGKLELSWKDHSLTLRKIPREATGQCRGTLIQETAARIGQIWCTTSGGMKDAFFKNPDMIVAWIILFYVQ